MGVIEILSELVKINSINPEWGGPGEKEIAGWVRRFFEDRNIEIEEYEVLPGRPNILAKVPGQNPGKRIVFEAHMDTVLDAGMTIPPFDPKIRDGKLYGRGSVDVKAGLAAMMQALTQIENPPCEVWVAAVIDEEHKYRGVLGLLDTLPSAEAAVVAEPTGNRIVRANKGVLRFKIQTHGKASHSAKPELGKNAISEMAKVITRFESHNQQLTQITHPLVGSPTCSIGMIEGGTQVNIVPDQCHILLDRRMIPGEKSQAILEEYQSLLSDLDCTIEDPYLSDEAMETPESAKVVQTSQSILQTMGGNWESMGVPFGCDATKLSRAGIPSIIFGPGSIDQAHAEVEFVEIEQVEFAAEFYRRFMEEFEG